MSIELSTPDVGQLGAVVGALRDWQDDASPLQLHPGDLGWFWRFGAEATAAAVRTWSRDGQVLALGLLDGPEVLRMTVAPSVWRDEEVARQVAADVVEPARGVLPAGRVSVEAPDGTRVHDLLGEVGWSAGEPWTPLRRDLTGPVAATNVAIEVIGPDQASDCTTVLRSAFGSTRFTEERWHAMASGLPFADARCLLAYDDVGTAVAEVTVWSAGLGKPGLIEPMGVHAEHRGRGYGRAICVAAAGELRTMGSSSVLVCTESARAAAVATYRSAGFQRLPERLDRSRDA
ncbi:GNAT family N-acetyltransferase [Cellulomonas sp. McL0617]|uniref:GNAT family N-acetyltransferase n=1 Tax=Cellulomonas sp. McL0617 TaxID=3415675 RepID=UPI003CF0C13D